MTVDTFLHWPRLLRASSQFGSSPTVSDYCTVPHLFARVPKQLMQTSAQRAPSRPAWRLWRSLRAACAHAIPHTLYPRSAGCPVLASLPPTPAVLVGRSIISSSNPSVPSDGFARECPRSSQVKSNSVTSSQVKSSQVKSSQVKSSPPALARDYLSLIHI